jgi:branched-chain amino acid transport system substrate-binding protein
MVQKRRRLLATLAVVAAVAAGCTSSSRSSAGSASQTGGTQTGAAQTGGTGATQTNGAAASGRTYTVGVLTDVTGVAASANKTFPQGVQAGTVLASKDGYTIKYVVGDTTSTPAGALAAAQKLVQQNHVFAILVDSSFAFAAANYLASHNVPVIGADIDAGEWATNKNMFSVWGVLHFNLVATTEGQFFKNQGVTTVGTLGYSIAPSSAESAKGAAESSRRAGLKVGYVNANFPFGSTNVQPVALAMKGAGVDGFTPSVDPNTGFALITALRQLGADVKVALLPDGYGGDLLQAGPGALQAAQNVYFALSYQPVEMHTSATEQFVSDLKAAGVSGAPTLANYHGYVSVGLLLEGLKGAGSNATPAALITALSNIHDWTAVGLFGTHKLDINNRDTIINGPDNCIYFTKLVGSTFQTVSGADPLCGTTIPGVTVSASS